MDRTETKIIASARYEIRLLLSSYIGTEVDAPADVRFAAHLAYALHNEALALVAGGGFDIQDAPRRVAAIDGILGTDEGERLAYSWGAKTRDKI